MMNFLRHIWNSSFKELVKEIWMKLTGVRASDAEKIRLKGMPRFVSGETSLLGKMVHFADAPSYLFMCGEIFESKIYHFKCASKRPYIIDCGANIGLSVIYFKKLFPDSSLLAFEPDEKIFNLLNYNVMTFGLQGVTLCNKAVWGQEVRLPFIQEGADAGRIDSSVSGGHRYEVEATTLSQYLDRPVAFLKIDIEGAEGEVLEECKGGLANVERVFLEYHSDRDGPQCLGRILEILKEAGFRYFIQQTGVTSRQPFIRRHTYNSLDNQLNIFAYRQ